MLNRNLKLRSRSLDFQTLPQRQCIIELWHSQSLHGCMYSHMRLIVPHLLQEKENRSATTRATAQDVLIGEQHTPSRTRAQTEIDFDDVPETVSTRSPSPGLCDPSRTHAHTQRELMPLNRPRGHSGETKRAIAALRQLVELVQHGWIGGDRRQRCLHPSQY